MPSPSEASRCTQLLAFARKQIEYGGQFSVLRGLSSANVNRKDGERHLSSEKGTHSSRLKFDDHREVFNHKTSWELLRGLLVLRICGLDIVADNALKIFRFGRKFLGERVLGWVLRPTVYAQFVAASKGSTGRRENPRGLKGEESFRISREAEDGLKIASDCLKSLGLRLMVAPTLEGDVGEGGEDILYEKNLQELLQLAELAWDFGNGNDHRHPCLQVKATALLSADILRNIAAVFQGANESTRIKLVELVAQSAISPFSNPDLWKPFPGVSMEVTNAFYKGARRLGQLGEVAKNKGLRLMVDAEYSYVNPAVSLLALSAMAILNQKRPIICHTLQCYFKGAMDNLNRELQVSNALGICYGAKIVRGAYLEQERSLANNNSGALTCSSYADTGNNYKRVITHFMEYAAKVEPGRCFVVAATHNEEGVRHAIDTIHSLGISPQDGRIVFAQIYGMAEQISMPLIRGGYIVYKSVPVGGLSQVLPYLARRAAENRAVLLGARMERELLQKELIWRLKSQCIPATKPVQ